MASENGIPESIASTTIKAPRCRLIELPIELLASILWRLPNRDIKNLRRTGRFFAKARLRIQRVFLSPHPRTIKIFRAIAEHDWYRHMVVEIIWDDAQLIDKPWKPWEDSAALEVCHFDFIDSDVPHWFVREVEKSKKQMMERKGQDRDDLPHHVEKMSQLASQLSIGHCWIYYQGLLRQQERILRDNVDAEALRYGLKRFHHVKAITITPAAHGFLFTPLYQIPMIRAFPKGFTYPIPRGWPCWEVHEKTPSLPRWEKSKAQWRGFSIVTSVLAEQHNHVTHLVLDTHLLLSGLNCRVFEDIEYDEYKNFTKVLSAPGFCRLDLSLAITGVLAEEEGGSPDLEILRAKNLKSALAKATDLECFRFWTDAEMEPYRERYTQMGTFRSLRDVIPIDKWPRLRQFSISRAVVQQDDLISQLMELPLAVNFIELSLLVLIDGTYETLFNEIRTKLKWHERDESDRPKVMVFIYSRHYQIDGRAIRMDEGVRKFLYENGKNPFVDQVSGPQLEGDAGVQWDAFEPEHQRPDTFAEIQRLSYQV